MCLIESPCRIYNLCFYILFGGCYLTFVIDVQEIKFEPSVMCEPIEKRCTFRASQVYVMHKIHSDLHGF